VTNNGNCIDCANEYLTNKAACSKTQVMSITRSKNSDDIVIGDAFNL
jgi:hypothetical protein